MLNAWTFNYEGLLTAYAVRRRGVWSGTFFISHWEIQWQMYWYSAGYLNNYIVLVYYFHSTDKIVHRRFLSEAKSAALSLVNLWPIWGRLYCVRALPHRHFNSTCIDVEFTYYKIHLFKVHNQWFFATIPNNQSQNILSPQKRNPAPISSHSPFPLSPSPWQPQCIVCLRGFSSLDISCKWNSFHTFFRHLWRDSFSQHTGLHASFFML